MSSGTALDVFISTMTWPEYWRAREKGASGAVDALPSTLPPAALPATATAVEDEGAPDASATGVVVVVPPDAVAVAALVLLVVPLPDATAEPLPPLPLTPAALPAGTKRRQATVAMT